MAKTDKLYQKLTPLFDPDMGKRMGLMRMNMLMDQTELGGRLGISQVAVSRLESGHARVNDNFSFARFKAIFGDATTFIFYGGQEGSVNPTHIRQKYWRAKLKARRKPGSGLWKKDNPKGADVIRDDIRQRIKKREGG